MDRGLRCRGASRCVTVCCHGVWQMIEVEEDVWTEILTASREVDTHVVVDRVIKGQWHCCDRSVSLDCRFDSADSGTPTQ